MTKDISDVETLASMLDGLSATLRALGERHWSDWMAQDANRLRRGDAAAGEHFLSAFGGMGSINDLYICPQNGHLLEESDVPGVNEKLRDDLSKAWSLASRLNDRR